MRSPYSMMTSLCVIMLLFVCDRVVNAQELAPDNPSPEDVLPELTPDEEIPWEDAPKKETPEAVAPEKVAPEKEIVAEDFVVTNEHKMAVMLLVGSSGNSQSSASGFACKFKNREFIATNLHLIENLSAIKVTSLSGNPIELSDQMIVSEDADICLYAIKGSFADLGIVPFEFMDDVLKGSKSGDEVICLGRSPGDEGVTTTEGKLRTRGQSSVETDAPVVKGNIGGPIVHRESNKVIGLVTQSILDDAKSDSVANAVEVAIDSTVGGISCSGHRLDTVKKWKSLTFAEYKKSSLAIATARGNMDNIYKFLTDKPGWRDDRSLATAWDNYEKFLEGSDGKKPKETDGNTTNETDVKTTKEIPALGEADEFASFKASISRMKAKGVSQGDYDKARLSIIKAVDWKIQAAQDVIKNSTPIGPRQIETINQLKSDTQQLAKAIKEL